MSAPLWNVLIAALRAADYLLEPVGINRNTLEPEPEKRFREVLKIAEGIREHFDERYEFDGYGLMAKGGDSGDA